LHDSPASDELRTQLSGQEIAQQPVEQHLGRLNAARSTLVSFLTSAHGGEQPAANWAGSSSVRRADRSARRHQ